MVAENGGSPILGYELWRDDGNNGDFINLYTVDTMLSLSYLDMKVEKGVIYRYKYRARNVNGWGDFSDSGYLFAANVPD